MVRPGHRAAGVLPHPFALRPRPVPARSPPAPLSAFRLSAGLIWPVSDPPIPDGALLAGADGRIHVVGPAAVVPRPAGVRSVDAPAAVLMPGLVNAHTHLELTGLRGRIAEPEFHRWIQEIRRVKRAARPEEFREASRRGVRDAWSWGITTVADTGDSGAVVSALSALGGRGIVYHEVFGPHPEQAERAMADLATAVRHLQAAAGPGVAVGVSPHAPYSVSAELYRRTVGFAREEGLRVAVHLAESPAEVRFVAEHAGPFADLWRRRGVPLPEPAPSPVAFLDRLGVLGPETLVIHGVQVSVPDAARLAAREAGVVLCPRSNRRHGHGAPPVARYLAAGVATGLGTDSVASVESLDLLAEARAVGEIAALGPAALLRLATLDGAAALGMSGEIGSLETGKWADLCLLAVDPAGSPEVVGRRLLQAGQADVKATWVGGRLVSGDWPAAR